MLSVEREPAVAGTFYSSNPAELIEQLKNCFDKAEGFVFNDISALIVPHAGYSYSGIVAASAYGHIRPDAEYENIFVIGSSHHVSFNGASVYNRGHYKTPLGVVPVNLELTNALIRKNKNFVFNRDAHSEEHTIEVQLPFLQYRIKQINQIVPIVIGVKNYEDCRHIAEALRPYFNNKNLFVFSTDFSHYPTDEDARVIDKKTANAICKNNAQTLIKQLEENNSSKVSNLYTSLCGWSSVLTLIYLTENDSKYKYRKIKYMNSSEFVNMRKNKVVGYQSILIETDTYKPDFISKDNKNKLLTIAHNAILKHLGLNDALGSIENLDDLKQFNSAFVSTYVDGKLRGCIGQFSSERELPDLIASLAVTSAFNDDRFPPLTVKELNNLSIEISVLTPMRRIDCIEDIELGKHGVHLEKDGKKGTFLPQVAIKTGWNLENFLGHLARDKAHIGWEGWRKAELSVFEAIVFSH